MTNIFKAFLLGTLQGLTEFLPVSSSGHLVLLQHFLGIEGPQLLFDVMLHIGTILAVCLVFYQKIWSVLKGSALAIVDLNFYRNPKKTLSENPELRFAWFIILGTIPAALVGATLKDLIESAFAKPGIVALMLIATGGILQLSRIGKNKEQRQELNQWDALRIGTAQAVAILPGISRSGSTISTALALGVAPQTAARYSFLLSIPAVLGAAVLTLKDIHKVSQTGFATPTVLIIGTLTALIVGCLAIKFLLSVLNRGRFTVFSYYCWAVGVGAIVAYLAIG